MSGPGCSGHRRTLLWGRAVGPGYLVCRRAAAPAVLLAAPLVLRAPSYLAVGPGCGAGLLGVPTGGGPPASRPRRELRSARRLEARPGPATAHRHRSQTPHDFWYCYVAPRIFQAPPAPSTPAVPGMLTYGLARHPDTPPALLPPTGTAARPLRHPPHQRRSAC